MSSIFETQCHCESHPALLCTARRRRPWVDCVISSQSVLYEMRTVYFPAGEHIEALCIIYTVSMLPPSDHSSVDILRLTELPPPNQPADEECVAAAWLRQFINCRLAVRAPAPKSPVRTCRREGGARSHDRRNLCQLWLRHVRRSCFFWWG